jgi:hypothetical protein
MVRILLRLVLLGQHVFQAGRSEFHCGTVLRTLRNRRNNRRRGKFAVKRSQKEVLMRRYILALATAALFVVPTAAFSEGVYIGPGGVRVGPGHHYYNRAEGGGRCRELHQACLHKNELGEQGMGNCERYRAMCH